MGEILPRERDFDLERVIKTAHEGLADVREPSGDVDPATLALDSFVIVAIVSYKTPDGEEREATAVWSEARKRYVQVGMLEAGRERLDDALDPDWPEVDGEDE